MHYCWNHFVSWHSVDLSCYLKMTGGGRESSTQETESRIVIQFAEKFAPNTINRSLSWFLCCDNGYIIQHIFMVKGQTCICADGGIPLHWSSFNAGSRRTSGKGLSMFLSLPLADDGLTTLPLLHSLLIHGPHLLINLKQKQ